MKKVYTLCTVCLLTFLLIGCGNNQNNDDAAAQELAIPASYNFESDSMSLADIEQMLEQILTEMQQNRSLTFRGKTYRFTGYAGGVEFGTNRSVDPEGNLRAGFGLDFRTSGPANQVLEKGKTYYETGITGTPAEVADYLDEMVANLASSGTFEMDIHTGEFVGTAIVDQRLVERPVRRRRGPFSLETFVTFGEGDVQRHDDDESYREDLEAGLLTPLGVTEALGADQAAVAEVISSLARSLRSGRIQVGDGEAQLGDNVRFRAAHLAGGEGGSQKIEFVLEFGPRQTRAEAEAAAAAAEAGPRYYVEEAEGTPMAEFAAMLQRIATEILEDGTFMLEGEEYTVGERLLGGEIGFNQNQMTVQVRWNQ